MKTFKIKLNEIEQAKIFNSVVTHYSEDMDLANGRYIIDAKSIMGLFSLDLSKEINLVVHTDDDAIANKIAQELKNKGIDISGI